MTVMPWFLNVLKKEVLHRGWIGMLCLGAGVLASSAHGADASVKSKPAKPVATAASLLDEAQSAYARKDFSATLNFIQRAMKLEPQNYRPYFARGRFYSAQGDSAKAIEDFNRVLSMEPSQSDVFQLRGIEHFREGHVADSLMDFDRYLSLNPSQTPYHWQRGISLYYSDRFGDGRKQFESHQTVNPQDVENAAWHFFCVARSDGVEKARALLYPMGQDSRIPMAQIHALLAGTGTAEQVLEAAQAGNPSPATLQRQMFYAHLYLGLYEEVQNHEKESWAHIEKAVQLASKEDYMGSVARVHAQLRKAKKKK